MDKKLTDSEIKEVLDMVKAKTNQYCQECPYDDIKVCNICIFGKMKIVIDLQAENKRLSTLAELGNTRANDYRVMRDRALKAEAEVERLKKEKDEYAYLYEKHINTAFSHIKAEAYKEFWEELKRRNTMDERIVSVATGDNLLKELVGNNETVL